MSDKQPLHRDWWIELLRESFGFSFWLFAALAVVTAGICYAVLGAEALTDAISTNQRTLADMLPKLAAAQVVAAMVWVLLPRDRLSRLLGNNSGTGALVIATVAGMITPGGPASAYPLLAIIAAAGADRGILVAYISSWALLGVQRIVVWDMPFMGAEFSLLRFLVSLSLPLIAGLIARRLPLSLLLETGSPGDNLRQ